MWLQTGKRETGVGGGKEGFSAGTLFTVQLKLTAFHIFCKAKCQRSQTDEQKAQQPCRKASLWHVSMASHGGDNTKTERTF